jgi:hypothetical protein
MAKNTPWAMISHNSTVVEWFWRSATLRFSAGSAGQAFQYRIKREGARDAKKIKPNDFFGFPLRPPRL